MFKRFKRNKNMRTCKKIVEYTGDEKTIVIVDDIEEIGDDAFSDNDSIEKVIIGSGVGWIGSYAFSGCENLKEVIIKKGNRKAPYIMNIENGAFEGCKNLKKVVFHKAVEDWGVGVFEDTGLEEFEMPEMLRNVYLSARMFKGCKYLKKLIMPSEVEAIGPRAFEGCKKLFDVSARKSIHNIAIMTPCLNNFCGGVPVSKDELKIKNFVREMIPFCRLRFKYEFGGCDYFALEKYGFETSLSLAAAYGQKTFIYLDFEGIGEYCSLPFKEGEKNYQIGDLVREYKVEKGLLINLIKLSDNGIDDLTKKDNHTLMKILKNKTVNSELKGKKLANVYDKKNMSLEVKRHVWEMYFDD